MKKQDLLAVAFLAFICALLYSNSLHGEFQFDDDRLIRFNFSLRDLDRIEEILRFEPFRPFTLFSFALNYRIGGKDPFSYHVVNVILHGTATILFYLFLRRVSNHPMYSFVAAALFAAHPLNTESVSYIASRSILLCTVFFWGSLLFFHSYFRNRQRSRLLPAFLFFFLALSSKEEAGLLPFTLLAVNTLLFGVESVKSHWKLHFATFFVVFAAFLYRFAIVSQSAIHVPHAPLTYFTTEVTVWLRYLWLAILPVRLNVDHSVEAVDPGSPVFWTAAAVVAGCFYLFWKYRKTQPLFSLWGFWFFLHLLASSSFFPLNDFMAEHRTYLSLFGFCGVAGNLVLWFSASKQSARTRPILLAIGGLFLFYSFATWQRNIVWQSRVALWHDAAQKSPDEFRPHLNLAYSLYELGAYDESIQEYLKARSLERGVARIHTGLGFCYLVKGRTDQAKDCFETALLIDSNYLDAKTGLGILAYWNGNYSEALSYFEQSYPARKEAVPLIAMMGVCYLKLGNAAQASNLVKSSQHIDFSLAPAVTMIQEGRVEEAVRVLSEKEFFYKK